MCRLYLFLYFIYYFTDKVISLFLDLFAQPSVEDDGLFSSEASPFTKKGGLFSGGGGLFDDDGSKVLVTVYM